ncbi:MAG TPA: response regulator [Phaeodactylibacter sp.]|nr:response regulator [Phaeodactylibacter sp.]
MNNSTKILIIEDNPADIALIEAHLKDGGLKHQLFSASSLTEGIGQLRKHEPDIVLLDLQLHDVEGFKTVQKFREQAPDLPVVVLTGFKNEIIGIQSVRAGAQDFLVKGDFDARSLVRTIRYSLQRFATQSKLKQKAEQLSNSERRSRLTHYIARFGRWEMDIVTYAMKWDDEIFKFFGFPPNSFSPSMSEYLKYVHVEDRSEVERFFEEAVNDGRLHSLTHRIVLENTVVKLFQVNAKINYDEKANRLSLLGSVQDITGQQPPQPLLPTTAPSDVEPNPEATPQSSRSLLSLFAFNLRTPAASLANLLYLMQETPLNEQQARYIKGMHEALEDFNFNLSNWTSTTEEIEYQPTQIDCLEFLHAMAQKVASRAQKSHTRLKSSFSQKLPRSLYADRGKLDQIITNLGELGINFNSSNTRMQLSFGSKGKREEGLTLLLRLQFQSETFDIEEAQRILQDRTPFNSQIVSSVLYLPLPILLRLSKFLEGKTELTQLSNRKYSIQVEIPVQSVAQAVPSEKNKPDQPLHILLAEDHDLHRLATQRMLTQWAEDTTVTTAKNGEEAVKKAVSAHYDIILMDLQMPLLNGVEATIKIRQNSEAPIIALTANESKQEQEHCRMVGMNDYLVKPVAPEQLFQAIMRQLPHTYSDSSP